MVILQLEDGSIFDYPCNSNNESYVEKMTIYFNQVLYVSYSRELLLFTLLCIK
jgi:hypothetical protein